MNHLHKPVFPIICFCFIAVLSACAQTEVLESPDYFRNEADWFFIGMKPESKILEIRASDLSELEKEDMSKFTKLETVVITFTAAPDAPFAEKQTIVAMVKKNLAYLVRLKDCPALKNVALQVGERLFLKESEKFTEEEAVKQNLARAGREFADTIKGILPKATIYAHNWGW
ncbi:MAG: hypothetical protein JW904_02755 [Spirochaetales bacterium]|nr:hypothetical protein [Spirochaetales bacterium]